MKFSYLPNILIETPRIIEHEPHALHGAGIPLANVGIEIGRVVKHAVHFGDAADVPI